jgi:flagellar hook-basal body complex protein FliE
MSVEAIAAVGAQLAAVAPAAAPAMSLAPPVDPSALAAVTDLLGPQKGSSVGESMFDRLVSSLGEIDAGVERNSQAATELALGQTDNLHQVLIGAEQTRLQFELAMSMRNRVLEAYQEIMRMQV